MFGWLLLLLVPGFPTEPPVTCHVDAFEPVYQPLVQLSKTHFGDVDFTV